MTEAQNVTLDIVVDTHDTNDRAMIQNLVMNAALECNSPRASFLSDKKGPGHKKVMQVALAPGDVQSFKGHIQDNLPSNHVCEEEPVHRLSIMPKSAALKHPAV